jgi:uncharacterized protein YndB with AHSA1/START domain
MERRIAAPPEVVFSYFTDPEKYRQWQGHEAELDPRPGGVFRVRMSRQMGTVASGTFVEIDPPRRIVYTWGWEQQDWLPEGMRLDPGSSTVEITLERDGETTILRLRHGGLPTEAACQFHDWGWDLTLDRLHVAAEGGDPGPNPFDVTPGSAASPD